MDIAALVSALEELGLGRGDRVLVHSSLSSLGHVEGGADTVIDALLEIVGPKGLVAVPTFGCEPPFDRKTSPTPLGIIADTLWRRPNAVRSKHPTHSVAAIGEGAAEFVKDHEKARTPCAEGTPYHTLAQTGGKVLLLGVDQDRNTTLHTAESLVGLPYLIQGNGTYIDDDGSEVTIPIADMSGMHRDYISLDKLFKDLGIMNVGKVGSAVCRLIDAGAMVRASVDLLKKDPAAVLCDNPECADAVWQRGQIKKARIVREDFTLAARASDISEHWDEIIAAVRGEGIEALEVTATDYLRFGEQIERENIKIVSICASVTDALGVAAARRLGVPITMLVSSKKGFEVACETQRSGVKTLVINAGMPSSFYEELIDETDAVLGFAFSPAQFAKAGQKPFQQVFYNGKIRKYTELFYVEDGTFNGHPTLPGQGNGEVKEILSMLRCRSFSGPIVLRSHLNGADEFRKTAKAFWDLLDNM